MSPMIVITGAAKTFTMHLQNGVRLPVVSGVSMHVMACLQLMNEAGGMQIPGATLGGVFNMGGAAVANYVSILERRK